jgi:RNA recognition motif-containing protein
VGKRITPHESTSALPGNHHYCFVDFNTAEDAKAAMEALNGKDLPSGPLKISIARAPRPKMDGESPRRSYNDETGTESPRRAPREPREPRDRDAPQRSLMSNNWRTK